MGNEAPYVAAALVEFARTRENENWETTVFPSSEIHELLNGYWNLNFPQKVVEEALSILSALKGIQIIDDPNTRPYVRFLGSGTLNAATSSAPNPFRAIVRTKHASAINILIRHRELGREWLDEALQNLYGNSNLGEKASVRENQDRVPASDRVVPLNHNAPEYQKFRKSLDDVIKEFREDHSFGNEPPLDRDVVLGELDAGKKMIAEGAARPRTIKELLAPALKWLSEEFAKKSIGELAKIAIKALLTWLKVIS